MFQDFGDVIPGHGGIMDRFDCQFLMATFVNVYIHSFIRTASPQKILQQVCTRIVELKNWMFFWAIEVYNILWFSMWTSEVDCEYVVVQVNFLFNSSSTCWSLKSNFTSFIRSGTRCISEESSKISNQMRVFRRRLKIF